MAFRINREVEVITNSATIVLFDPEGLKHRINDTYDWWARRSRQQLEIRKGRLVVVPTPMDGYYRVRITTGSLSADEKKNVAGSDDSYWLEVKSGSLHCTAGENLPGGGHTAKPSPDQILQVPPGRYRVGLYGLHGSNMPGGNLPNLIVCLQAIPEGAEIPAPKKAPELWPRRKADRRRHKKPIDKNIQVKSGHHLPEDGDAEWTFDMHTGMITLFDPTQLEHRVNDPADWMLDEPSLLQEAKLGHLAFVYSIVKAFRPAQVRLTMQPLSAPESSEVFRVEQSGWVKISSGRLFCGSSEYLPCNGKTPIGKQKGLFHITRGSYAVEFYAMKLESQYSPPRFIIRLAPLGDEQPPAGPTKITDIYKP